MAMACRRHGGVEESLQVLGKKARMKETTRKIMLQ
jgi:hypothetical protein